GRRTAATPTAPRPAAAPRRPGRAAARGRRNRPRPGWPTRLATPRRQELLLLGADAARSAGREVERHADRARPRSQVRAVEQLVVDHEPADPDLRDPQLDAHRIAVVDRPEVVDLVPVDHDAVL